MTYSFKRLLPPNVMMIGVLSEDSEAFNWLNGNTVPVATGKEMDERIKLMIAAGQLSPSTASAVPVQEDYFQKWKLLLFR